MLLPSLLVRLLVNAHVLRTFMHDWLYDEASLGTWDRVIDCTWMKNKCLHHNMTCNTYNEHEYVVVHALCNSRLEADSRQHWWRIDMYRLWLITKIWHHPTVIFPDMVHNFSVHIHRFTHGYIAISKFSKLERNASVQNIRMRQRFHLNTWCADRSCGIASLTPDTSQPYQRQTEYVHWWATYAAGMLQNNLRWDVEECIWRTQVYVLLSPNRWHKNQHLPFLLTVSLRSKPYNASHHKGDVLSCSKRF